MYNLITYYNLFNLKILLKYVNICYYVIGGFVYL